MRNLLLLLAALPLLAQPRAFEVASIKPAAPLSSQDSLAGRGPGMTVDGAQVVIRSWPMQYLIVIAYGVKPYQLTGPDWMRGSDTLFDVVAKLPDGGTGEQVPEMLQTLLKDRFKLTIHRESKDLAVYALVLDKPGAKLKEAPPGTPATWRMTPSPNVIHIQTTSDMNMFAYSLT